MSKERGLHPRRRKEAVVKRRLTPLLQEELSYRVTGSEVPASLKRAIKEEEKNLASLAKVEAIAPCLFCDAPVDLDQPVGHRVVISVWVDANTGEVETFTTGAVKGLDAAVCNDCIHRIKEYEDLVTEEVA